MNNPDAVLPADLDFNPIGDVPRLNRECFVWSMLVCENNPWDPSSSLAHILRDIAVAQGGHFAHIQLEAEERAESGWSVVGPTTDWVLVGRKHGVNAYTRKKDGQTQDITEDGESCLAWPHGCLLTGGTCDDFVECSTLQEAKDYLDNVRFDNYLPIESAPGYKILDVRWGIPPRCEYGQAKFSYGRWFRYGLANPHANGRECATPTGWSGKTSSFRDEE